MISDLALIDQKSTFLQKSPLAHPKPSAFPAPVTQLGRALRSGRRGFESRQPDHINTYGRHAGFECSSTDLRGGGTRQNSETTRTRCQKPMIRWFTAGPTAAKHRQYDNQSTRDLGI